MLVTTTAIALTRPPRLLAYIAADAGHPSALTYHRNVRWFRIIRITFYATGAPQHAIITASHQSKHASHVYSPLDQRGTCIIPHVDAPALHCHLETRRDL